MNHIEIEEKFVKIQLQNELNGWSGREVFLSHGPNNTVLVMNKGYFSDLQVRMEELSQKLLIPTMKELVLESTANSDITSRGALYLPDYLDEHLSKASEDDTEVYEISDRLLVLFKNQEVLRKEFIETLKNSEKEAMRKITILGKTYSREDIPNIAQMFDVSKENAERQIQSIADAWHEGNTPSAIHAFESDLAHG